MTEDLRGKRAVVMGLGLFSGGVEATRWLVARGARVLVTDLRGERELAPSIRALEGLPVEYRLGGHEPADFESADLVLVSPAVSPDHALLRAAAARGARLETETNLFLRACPARVTMVTGSNGKSTTASILGAALAAAGRKVHVGGNIGRSLVNRAGEMVPGDEVVLEISSFQLEWTGREGLRPAVGVVTNVTPNHLDRHGTFEAYRAAKAEVLPPAGEGRAAVLSHDDAGARSLGEAARCRVVRTALEGLPPGESVAWEGERLVARLGGAPGDPGEGGAEVLARADVRLRGTFNLRNVASAAAAALVLGVPAEAVRTAVRSFRGLPHRLEACGEVDGVLCVNDSKATTPEAALLALASFDRPLVAIAGGYDKKVDLGPLARGLAARARAVVLLGDTAERLAGLLGEAAAPDRPGPEVRRVGGIEEAVDAGLASARPGDVLLLSPGHASYGMFVNYEERGDRFRSAVRRRAAAAGGPDEWGCPPG